MSEKKGFSFAREDAVDELQQDSVVSFYLGLLHEKDGRKSAQYRISTEGEDPAIARNASSAHLGLLMRVLAEQTDMSLEEVASIGVERAREIDSLPVREDDIV